MRPPKFFWRLIRIPALLLYQLGVDPILGRFVLILITTGRKSGQPRSTPLQYEERNGAIYVGAVRGQEADWFRNIIANPAVEVQLKSQRSSGFAEPITDPLRIADFLELRLRRHPRMVGAILRGAGLPSTPTRAQLEEYAADRALVAIRPIEVETENHA